MATLMVTVHEVTLLIAIFHCVCVPSLERTPLVADPVPFAIVMWLAVKPETAELNVNVMLPLIPKLLFTDAVKVTLVGLTVPELTVTVCGVVVML